MLNMIELTKYDIADMTDVAILHTTYVIMVPILLVNFLIALMSNSVSEVAENRYEISKKCRWKFMTGGGWVSSSTFPTVMNVHQQSVLSTVRHSEDIDIFFQCPYKVIWMSDNRGATIVDDNSPSKNWNKNKIFYNFYQTDIVF